MSSSFYTDVDADDDRDGQPIAGPSNWWQQLWGLGREIPQRVSVIQEDEDAGAYGVEVNGREAERVGVREKEGSSLRWTRREGVARRPGRDMKGKRQASASSPTASPTTSPTSYSIPPLFVPPPSTSASASPISSGNATMPLGSPTSNSSISSSSYTSSATTTRERYSSSSSSTSSRSFTSLWTTKPPAYYTATPSATPTFVPGVTFNLTLGGSRDDEAIYAVQVDLGHGSTATSQQTSEYAWTDEGDAEVDEAVEPWRRRGKRQGAVTGAGYQRVKLQVDLGSSDMWVAANTCRSPDCVSAPALFDTTQSISSGVLANMTYHSGSVGGTIVWDEVQMDRFAIAYQAFIAGDRVVNENLSGGDFSGVLGMALPANSIISSQIPGTTSSNPDGATFLDNLFGSGTYAPTQRIFSLALERREDVRTTSILTIGSTYARYCPSPCSPSYLPIIANPNLGVIGYLHWRIPLMGVRATEWADPQRGTGASTKTVTLGNSMIISRSQPLAVVDSGGVAVLVGSKSYADAIYGAYGISASADGYYRMPCRTQLAFSFNFGGQWYPAHPLDMSWPDPTDPSLSTCIGAIQYAPISNEAGDFILGSSFLKNVYTVFSYPDQARNSGTWQPGVALISLTNASVASQDFYAVRTLRQSLAQVSSQGPFIGSSPSSPSATPSAAGTVGGSVVNTTAIVAGSVVGFFVLAALAFCAWFFFLKRKYGNTGYPLGRRAGAGAGGRDTPNSEPASTSTRRTKKHLEAHRQKSMIEGYSDYEGDSWTEGGDSVRLGYMPEVPEEAGMEEMRGKRTGSVGSSMMAPGMGAWGGAMIENVEDAEEELVRAEAGGNEKDALAAESPLAAQHPLPLAAPLAPPTTSRSNSRPRIFDPTSPDLSTFTYPPADPTSPSSPAPPLPYSQPISNASGARPTYPRSGSSSRHHPRSESISMSGPFPTTGRQRSLGDIDTSPMYEIRSADDFAPGEAARGRRGSAVGTMQGSRGAREGSGSGSREREGG